jgi:pilus assembly protein Flp/PilA
MNLSLAVLHCLTSDESGQDLIEYAFLAALIGLACLLSIQTLGGGVNSGFGTISSKLTSAI